MKRVKMGGKAAEREREVGATRRELSRSQKTASDHRAELMATVDRLRKDRDAQALKVAELEAINQRTMSELEAALSRSQRASPVGEGGRGRGSVPSQSRMREDDQEAVKRMLQAQEKRLRGEFMQELAEAVARTRQEVDQEIDVVLTTVRRRYENLSNEVPSH